MSLSGPGKPGSTTEILDWAAAAQRDFHDYVSYVIGLLPALHSALAFNLNTKAGMDAAGAKATATAILKPLAQNVDKAGDLARAHRDFRVLLETQYVEPVVEAEALASRAARGGLSIK
jgi:hypothetical protein